MRRTWVLRLVVLVPVAVVGLIAVRYILGYFLRLVHGWGDL